MNKSYLIVPAILLAGFFPLYKTASSSMAAAEAAEKQKIAAATAAADLARKDLDLKAEADARTRQDERDRLDRERDAKKKADYADAMRRLTEERTTYATEAARFSAEVTALEKQLAELKTARETANREVFELARQVELPKIERRSAELEIQRAYAMVSSRVAASSIANPPPPAPTAVR